MFSRIKKTLSSRRYLFVVIVLITATVSVYLFLRRETETALPTIIETVELSPLNISVEPKSGEVEIGGTTIGVSLFFDGLVDPSSVQVEVFPPFTLVPKVLADSPERVVLSPSRPWVTGITYRVTIKKGIKAEVTGRTLMEDVVLEYKVREVPEEIEEYSPHL